VLDVQLWQCAYIPILYIIYYTYLLELLVMFFRFIIVNFTSFCGKLLGILCTLTIGIFVIGMDVFIIVLYLFGYIILFSPKYSNFNSSSLSSIRFFFSSDSIISRLSSFFCRSTFLISSSYIVRFFFRFLNISESVISIISTTSLFGSDFSFVMQSNIYNW
jgi:hypothetical protein